MLNFRRPLRTKTARLRCRPRHSDRAL